MDMFNPYTPPRSGEGIQPGRGGTPCVRIIGVPPGEAPEPIRRSWVGLVLPLAPGERGPRSPYTIGVLTGPKGFFDALIGLLLGRLTRQTGYVVDANVAVNLLGGHSPEAARWWLENAPHLLRRGRRFVFSAEVCELAE